MLKINRNTRPRLAVLAWLECTAMIASISLTPCHTTAATVNVIPLHPPSQPQSAEYMVYGQGRLMCDAYTKARQQAQAGAYLELNYFRHWMAGYMSSHNLFRRGGHDSIAAEGDEEFIESSLDAYCRKNPGERFASAAADIIKQLGNRHQRPQIAPSNERLNKMRD